jgi:hypothetical protein
MEAPVVPDNISLEMMENLKPLPKCVHGTIHNLCVICNKEFYFPEIFNN